MGRDRASWALGDCPGGSSLSSHARDLVVGMENGVEGKTVEQGDQSEDLGCSS